MEVVVLHPKSGKSLATFSSLSSSSTILDVKKEYQRKNPKYYITRQAFKIDPKGKLLKEDEKLGNLAGSNKKITLYFKDLGPQVGWTTVFLTEYTGPLVIYLMFYTRPSIIYGVAAAAEPRAQVVNIACACFSFHYIKRVLETLFVHRFSNATMPIQNIFKNSIYYWGFAAFISYFINHPLYTPPVNDLQVYGGLAAFLFGELGNYSIHIALKNLRPPGTKERRIPVPTGNPLTALFNMVSCPNYTYEAISWISFSIMTQCLPAALFTACGFYQMAVWALGKHRNYKREFKDYPRGRKSIIPFVL